MRRLLSVFVLTLPIWFAQPVMAQSATVTSGSSTDSSSVTRNTHQDWQSLCELREENTICHISQTRKIYKDGQVDFTMRITLIKQAGKILMEIVLPLGLDLPAGIALQVDESSEINLPFATCVTRGCAVVVQAEEDLFNQLRKGTILKVAFRPFAQAQNYLFNVSLRGFTSAMQVLSD